MAKKLTAGDKSLLGVIVAAMALIVAIDVPFQLWQFHDKMKMSRQEAKQENKELEGNPEIKGRIRQLQRKAARKRMMSAVPVSRFAPEP